MKKLMPLRYRALVWSNSEKAMVRQIKKLCRNKKYAEKISAIGLSYIKKYRNQESVDQQIDYFVENI